MGFWERIVEKKGFIVGTAAAAVAIGLALLYRSYENQGTDASDDSPSFDLKKQIDGLRSQINVADPSLDDIKLVLEFSMSYAKKKIYSFSKQFKKKRQSYTSVTRKEKMSEYMSTIASGMEQIQSLATTTQTEILTELGLSEASFRKHQAQLGMFMQELMMRQQAGNESHKEMSLEEVKYAIRLQIQFLKSEGEAVVKDIIEVTKSWPPQKKQELPFLLAIVIADGAFEEHPEIDEEAVQAAEMKLQHHLMAEMSELQQVLNPLMRTLSMQLGGAGMGGMGGMGMGMEGMEGMEGMGMEGMGLEGMGMTMEQMQQLQQLEQLRLQDPAAFEQMMRNMYF